jgi:thiosulfate/3-mercaptopyruvate sulfurtransferase
VQRAAAAAVSVAVSSRLASTAAANTIIDAAKARQLLESKEAKFIDVRAPEGYSEGHIPTAANVYTFFTYLATSDDRGVRDLTDTFTEELRNAGIYGNEHVVTYENSLNTLYGASCRALYILRLLGHPRVSVLGGGYEGWVQDAHPTTTETQHIPKGNFQPKWTPSMWKGKAEVLEALGNSNTVLLDVRDSVEWKGESSVAEGVPFVTPRKGRLPGATHILWKDFMETGESGQVRFKRPEEIRSMCETKGVTPDKEVIVYCFKGARASNTYLALKDAGFENVSNYFASWNEWSRDDKLEIDSKLL